jgi:hypothetical protein
MCVSPVAADGTPDYHPILDEMGIEGLTVDEVRNRITTAILSNAVCSADGPKYNYKEAWIVEVLDLSSYRIVYEISAYDRQYNEHTPVVVMKDAARGDMFILPSRYCDFKMRVKYFHSGAKMFINGWSINMKKIEDFDHFRPDKKVIDEYNHRVKIYEIRRFIYTTGNSVYSLKCGLIDIELDPDDPFRDPMQHIKVVRWFPMVNRVLD